MTPTGIPEKLYLNIVALEDVWVLVRTDSSPQKKATLKKGESVTWSADERFLLSYGSVGAAKLELNGKELVVNGPKNAVVRDLIITSAGVAFQKVESEKPKPRKPKPVTQATPTAQPQLAPQIPVTPVPQAPAPPAPEPTQQPTTPWRRSSRPRRTNRSAAGLALDNKGPSDMILKKSFKERGPHMKRTLVLIALAMTLIATPAMAKEGFYLGVNMLFNDISGDI